MLILLKSEKVISKQGDFAHAIDPDGTLGCFMQIKTDSNALLTTITLPELPSTMLGFIPGLMAYMSLYRPKRMVTSTSRTSRDV
jgi:hypothetical protein